MTDFVQNISHEVLVYALALVLVLSLFLLITTLAIRHRWHGFRKKWSLVLDAAAGSGFEEVFSDMVKRQKVIEEELKEILAQQKLVNQKASHAVQNVGYVRFDAFDDVGGEQSFVAALYNDFGDGLLITSLVGRQDCRVYGKIIKSGTVDRSLLPEEKQAIEAAKSVSRFSEKTTAL